MSILSHEAFNNISNIKDAIDNNGNVGYLLNVDKSRASEVRKVSPFAKYVEINNASGWFIRASERNDAQLLRVAMGEFELGNTDLLISANKVVEPSSDLRIPPPRTLSQGDFQNAQDFSFASTSLTSVVEAIKLSESIELGLIADGSADSSASYEYLFNPEYSMEYSSNAFDEFSNHDDDEFILASGKGDEQFVIARLVEPLDLAQIKKFKLHPLNLASQGHLLDSHLIQDREFVILKGATKSVASSSVNDLVVVDNQKYDRHEFMSLAVGKDGLVNKMFTLNAHDDAAEINKNQCSPMAFYLLDNIREHVIRYAHEDTLRFTPANRALVAQMLKKNADAGMGNFSLSSILHVDLGLSSFEAKKIQEEKENELQEWVKAPGLLFANRQLADNSHRLLAMDTSNRLSVAAWGECGFVPLSYEDVNGQNRFDSLAESSSTRLFMCVHDSATRPRLDKLQNAGINDLELVWMSNKEVIAEFNSRLDELYQSYLNDVLLDAHYLGTNPDNQPVFYSPIQGIGRFIRDNNSILSELACEPADAYSAKFLRATWTDSPNITSSLVEHFVSKLADPRVDSDFKRFKKSMDYIDSNDAANALVVAQSSNAQSIFVKDLIGNDTPIIDDRALFEMMEFHFNNQYGDIDVEQLNSKRHFERAVTAYLNYPKNNARTANSIALQQFSTPIPLSLVGQRLISHAAKGMSSFDVFEPTIGNGALVSALKSKGAIYGFEIDPSRIQNSSSLAQVNVAQFDSINSDYHFALKDNEFPSQFDFLIANPPFGTMGSASVFQLAGGEFRTKKTDFDIVLRSLEVRKDEGLAVVIVGAEGRMSDGTLTGHHRHFLKFIADHYELKSAVEIDGKRFYERNGTAFNTRMLVIGNARDKLIDYQLPDKLPLISTFDDLWDWSSKLLPEIASKLSVEPVQATNKAGAKAVQEANKVDVEPVQEANKVGAKAVQVTNKVGAKAVQEANKVGAKAVQEANKVGAKAVQEANKVGEKLDLNGSKIDESPVELESYEDKLQDVYSPASSVSKSASMIPINQAGSVYSALNKVEKYYGKSVDEIVSDRMGYNIDELGKYFSAEQVDAVALGIYQLDNGRAMINADQTGMGKGRWVAAMIACAIDSGKTPVFLTKKSDLFSDIFRDLREIGKVELIDDVFIFNSGQAIQDPWEPSERLFPATRSDVFDRALSEERFPESASLVLSTYSQFGRSLTSNKKAQLFLKAVNENCMLILDEAHEAAGLSNTGETMQLAVKQCGAVMYASATPLKGVDNFHVYGRCFPESVDLDRLPDTLLHGGEALLEAISTNMAMDGVIIRREHDFRKLTFTNRYPSDAELAPAIDRSDELSDILCSMAALSFDVSAQVAGMNQSFKESGEAKGSGMRASSMQFGSRLFQLNRQYLLASSVDNALEAALEALKNNQKPVFGVENTGESLLRQVLTVIAGDEHDDWEQRIEEIDSQLEGDIDSKEAVRLKTERKELEDKLSSGLIGMVIDKPPQYRDLLLIMLEKLKQIKVNNGYGNIKIIEPSSPEWHEAFADTRAKIEQFQDLDLSPLDTVRMGIMEAGFTVGEISGRSLFLRKIYSGENAGKWMVDAMPASKDNTKTINKFQRGKLDAVILTRSGSTGISLHSEQRFEDSDLRQRNFIMLQRALNISEFLQWIGRVNRKGQVNDPVITTIETGLPAEQRLTMMHNAKLRKLSANTTSNRNNVNENDVEADLLSCVGELAAIRYLIDNPEFTELMGIKLPDDSDYSADPMAFTHEQPYVNRTLGRLMLLDYQSQIDLLADLTNRYGEVMLELEAEGINPFSIDIADWNAQVEVMEELNRDVFTSSNDSSFDAPVNHAIATYSKTILPLRSSQLMDLCKQGWAKFDEAFSDEVSSAQSGFKKFSQYLKRKQLDFLKTRVPKRIRDVTEINSMSDIDLILRDDKGLKGLSNDFEKSNFLISNVALDSNGNSVLDIGNFIRFNDPETGSREGVVVGLSYPSNDKEIWRLSCYEVHFAEHGKECVDKIPLSRIFMQSNESIFGIENLGVKIEPGMDLSDHQSLDYLLVKQLQMFDEAPSGERVVNQDILVGNIFSACMKASKERLGKPILYTDEQGNRHRAMLLRGDNALEKLNSKTIAFKPEQCLQYIAMKLASEPRADIRILQHSRTSEKPPKPGEQAVIERDRYGNWSISMSGSKARAGKLLTDASIFSIEGYDGDSLDLYLKGNRTLMSAEVPEYKLDALINRLFDNKHFNNFFVHNQDDDLVKVMTEANSNNVRYVEKDIENKIDDRPIEASSPMLH